MSPSPFVTERMEAWRAAHGRPVPRVLDVAMGRGRHALALARGGWRVFGVDRNRDALFEASMKARRESIVLSLWCADLTSYPLPRSAFDVVLVTRYLQRDLFAAIAAALAPGGAVVYETFTTRQLALGTGPTSPDHLLRPGELRAAFAGLEIVSYEEAEAPEAVARLVAERPR